MSTYWRVMHTNGEAFHFIGADHYRPMNPDAKRITQAAYERGKAAEPKRDDSGRMPRAKKERTKHEPRITDKREASRLRREARKTRRSTAGHEDT